MAFSPLQKRIHELSARVIETDNYEEFQRVASELRNALREQVDYLRAMVDEAKKSGFTSHARSAHSPKREEKRKKSFTKES